jgi:hypothetical protein
MSKSSKVVAEGEKLTPKTIARLKSLRVVVDEQNDTVRAKSDAKGGQWICADCGEPFQNNMQADQHSTKHRLGWWVLSGNDPHMEVP